MDFEFSDEQLAYKAEVIAFCDEHDDIDIFDVTRENMAQIVDTPKRRAFMKEVGHKGWLGMTWPKEYGGSEGEGVYEYILNEELAGRGGPQIGKGVGIIGKTVIAHGSDFLKEKFLPMILENDVEFAVGRVTALMGRNGAGKSSLLWALQGTGTRTRGRVRLADGTDPAALTAHIRRRRVGLVPQSAGDLLYLDTVGAECSQADRESGRDPGTCAGHLERLAPGIPPERHPGDLSEGGRLALVLAVQLTAGPEVILLDEPTRGLDYSAKAALGTMLCDLAAAGHTVVVSTHDVEFVAETADDVILMAQGEVVAQGPTAEVVAASPAFAPQVAKVFHPLPLLTLRDVRVALGDGRVALGDGPKGAG